MVSTVTFKLSNMLSKSDMTHRTARADHADPGNQSGKVEPSVSHANTKGVAPCVELWDATDFKVISISQSPVWLAVASYRDFLCLLSFLQKIPQNMAYPYNYHCSVRVVETKTS